MNSYGLLISDLFTPFGFSPGLIAIYGIVFFFSGISGTIVFAIIADKTLKLKLILLILGGCTTLGVFGVSLFVTDIFSARVVFTLILCTFFGVAFLPQAINFAAELTFPMQPAVITGGMILTMQVTGSLMILLYNFIL